MKPIKSSKANAKKKKRHQISTSTKKLLKSRKTKKFIFRYQCFNCHNQCVYTTKSKASLSKFKERYHRIVLEEDNEKHGEYISCCLNRECRKPFRVLTKPSKENEYDDNEDDDEYLAKLLALSLNPSIGEQEENMMEMFERIEII
jgi:hypothetical protein